MFELPAETTIRSFMSFCNKKFWDNCFLALTLYILIKSFGVGRGGNLRGTNSTQVDAPLDLTNVLTPSIRAR